MKYERPIFRLLTWTASSWCQVGSNGDPSGSTCNTGMTPVTSCAAGMAYTYNYTGHCISGSSVSNNHGGNIYCGTGGGGKTTPGCSAGANACGPVGCTAGALACHCNNGTTA